MMSRQAQNWLESLPAGSINCWEDLCTAFVQYYQAACPGPKTRWDLGSVMQRPSESLLTTSKGTLLTVIRLRKLMTGM
jgi:hypothetical protein